MSTYEIDHKELESLPLIADGYKVIDYDGGTQQNFKYTKEIGEPLVGRIFRVNGKIGVCKWGLHFCKNPANVFRFYKPRGYRRYFKVRAYGKVIDDEDGLKSVAECLEFVMEYNIMEFANIIRAGSVAYSATVSDSDAVSYSTTVSDSTAVYHSDVVSDSTAVYYSDVVSDSASVRGSIAVSYSDSVRGSIAVSNSNAVNYSAAVRGSASVWGSNGVDYGIAVKGSNSVSDSTAVDHSEAVSGSVAVSRCGGVLDSIAVVSSFGLRNCIAVFRCLFCNGLKGKTLYIFNKETTPERYAEVLEKITSFGWFPKFNNFYELKGDKAWYTIPFPEVRCVDNKTAWSKMPEKMREYIQSLPEYDEVIFKKITE